VWIMFFVRTAAGIRHEELPEMTDYGFIACTLPVGLFVRPGAAGRRSPHLCWCWRWKTNV
jgi:hypothetical protein